MSYRVVGTGPQFPSGYEIGASTASEVLAKLKAARNLCTRIVIYDDTGRQVGWPELARLAEAEAQAERRQLATKHG